MNETIKKGPLNMIRNALLGRFSGMRDNNGGGNILYDYSSGEIAVLYDKKHGAIYEDEVKKLVDAFIEGILKKIDEKVNNLDENEKKNEISRIIGEISTKITNSSACRIEYLGVVLDIPCILTAKIQNGKVIERKFGTKENGQQYTTEEVKVILKNAEENGCGKKFKDGRKDKFTFLSLIADMDNNLIGENSKNPTRFIKPDQNDKDLAYDEIEKIVKQAREKGSNSPNILLIPYSADGHIVTLLVDEKEFPSRCSCACFDSSHYFNEFHGIFEFIGLSKSLSTKHFPEKLFYALDAYQQPINRTRIQGLNGTCSFYTEAFCYIMSDYIRRNPQKTLDDIKNYINTKEFEKRLEETKTEFFNQYKATMKGVEEKLEMQRDNKKRGSWNKIQQKIDNSHQMNNIISDC